MFPDFLEIGPLTIHTYGVLVAAGVLVGLGLAAKQAGKTGVARDRILDFGRYALLSGIIGARVFLS
jgi:phosphatidylglycerol---prolipoprotein diacylglyceryl transferase